MNKTLVCLMRLAGVLPCFKDGWRGTVSQLWKYHTLALQTYVIVTNIYSATTMTDKKNAIAAVWRALHSFCNILGLLSLYGNCSALVKTMQNPVGTLKNEKLFQKQLNASNRIPFILLTTAINASLIEIYYRKIIMFFSTLGAHGHDSKTKNDNALLYLICGGNMYLIKLWKLYIIFAALQCQFVLISSYLIAVHVLNYINIVHSHMIRMLAGQKLSATLLEKPREHKAATSSVKYCVILHQYCIRALENVDKAYSFNLLTIILRIFATSAYAYMFTAKEYNNINIALEVFSYSGYLVIFLFLTAFSVDSLVHKVRKMSYLCVSLAHTTPLDRTGGRISSLTSARRSLLVMTARLQNPPKIWAGPFYRLSIKTFRTVLGAAISYFTFFFTLRQQQELKQN